MKSSNILMMAMLMAGMGSNLFSIPTAGKESSFSIPKEAEFTNTKKDKPHSLQCVEDCANKCANSGVCFNNCTKNCTKN